MTPILRRSFWGLLACATVTMAATPARATTPLGCAGVNARALNVTNQPANNTYAATVAEQSPGDTLTLNF
jgi:hypothetical protein